MSEKGDGGQHITIGNPMAVVKKTVHMPGKKGRGLILNEKIQQPGPGRLAQIIVVLFLPGAGNIRCACTGFVQDLPQASAAESLLPLTRS